MADRPTSRWPTVTGLWLGLATWVYAALASVELLGIDYDPTDPASGYGAVPGWVPVTTHAATLVLGGALVLALASVVSGRARRSADLLLAVGLGLGAAVLWGAEEPRPVAPVVVAAAAVALALLAPLPERPAEGRLAGFVGRLLLATVALLLAWLCLHELSDLHFDLASWTVLSWSGLVVAGLVLLAALLGPLLASPVARWSFGLPTLLAGLAGLVGAVVGMREGYLLTGFEEVEPGWWLGGPTAYIAAGLTAAGLALLRSRPTLAVGTVVAALLTTLGVVFGIPEVRSGF
ncbi:hypothetical protein GCM10009623_35220 [Nocardioides aestuarii]|uniref:Uncharacterized protein n=1 Tax=Nocardioides aestuarii TaxID=252231 RepID=A0ABW4TQZ3_9ACTN